MSTHPRFAPAGLALLSLVLAGCGEESVEAIGEPTYAGEYVGHGPTPPFRAGSAPIRLTLRDGGISFTASCNHFYADADMTGGVLRTSSLGGTEIGCVGSGQAQDEWMVGFFGSSPRVVLDGEDLSVGSLHFRQAGPPPRDGPPGR
jgi:heat shock protein HslJ